MTNIKRPDFYYAIALWSPPGFNLTNEQRFDILADNLLEALVSFQRLWWRFRESEGGLKLRYITIGSCVLGKVSQDGESSTESKEICSMYGQRFLGHNVEDFAQLAFYDTVDLPCIESSSKSMQPIGDGHVFMHKDKPYIIDHKVPQKSGFNCRSYGWKKDGDWHWVFIEYGTLVPTVC